MYHTIEFCTPFMADLEISPKHRMERLRIRKGTRVCVFLLPSVLETPEGPMEVADLCFDDGSIARQVPYAAFHFVDSD